MHQSVHDFVAQCKVCQEVKPLHSASPVPLQPLPIPCKIWDVVSIDFITHLQPSLEKTAVLVVVDRLSKYAHLCSLAPHITALALADPLFTSTFWQELFKLQGTLLSTSSSYHPQSDGQTEVVSRCLEDYLSFFIADQLHTWVKFLHWARWSYNTSWHSSIKMTPFKAVYRRTLPHCVTTFEVLRRLHKWTSSLLLETNSRLNFGLTFNEPSST